MPFIKLEIEIPDEYQEMLIAELDSMEFIGFDQYDDHLIAWINASDMNDVNRETIEALLMGIGKGAHIRAEEQVGDTNWNEQWEQTIQPMKVGRFYITPSWGRGAEAEKEPDLIILEIDPKMSFGTGYHETTRIMLRMMPDVLREWAEHNGKGDDASPVVLDAGTGTGILGIAALKLGAESVFGFDIDEWSSVNTEENVLLNEVSGKFTVKQGDESVIPDGAEYDIVLANINRNILEDMSATLTGRLKKGGTLMLSGLLETDEEIIRNHKDYRDLEFIRKKQEGEWIGLVLRK